MSDLKQNAIVFEIENTTSEKRIATLFGESVFTKKEHSFGLNISMKINYSCKRIADISKPFFTEGIVCRLLHGDCSQMRNSIIFSSVTHGLDYDFHAPELPDGDIDYIEMKNYAFTITDKNYIQIEINPNTKIEFTLFIKDIITRTV